MLNWNLFKEFVLLGTNLEILIGDISLMMECFDYSRIYDLDSYIALTGDILTSFSMMLYGGCIARLSNWLLKIKASLICSL